GAVRAEYDHESLFEILDAGMVAHVGVPTPEGPIVLPMAYGRSSEHLYLHGAAANAMLRRAIGTDVCATVTILDGLVVARSPFHNSMNYRSVVVRGVATEVEGSDAQRAALRLISNHVVQTWETGRPPTDVEIRRTLVLRVPLVEMSGKVRTGGPSGDEPGDIEGPHWAGHVQVECDWGAPVRAHDLSPGIEPPSAVTELQGRRLR
ncbi:MAG TPA: pyridoxamine 5'-phosphate oxidase family protein, partial [Acidimicrobiales bacterium]|nr:pyridoxamine 5'-phosphate oxidase family protein [Acidimicrobiales bacterium]